MDNIPLVSGLSLYQHEPKNRGLYLKSIVKMYDLAQQQYTPKSHRIKQIDS